MGQFIDLPINTFSLISEWLSIRDIGRMDIAICNKMERQNFLQSLEEIFISINLYEFALYRNRVFYPKHFLLWIIRRKVQARVVYIDDFRLKLKEVKNDKENN